MNKLVLHKTESVDELAWPAEQDKLSLESPAMEFFTDFEKIPPLVLDASTPAVDARNIMRNTHVHMHFVLNQDQRFVGIVTSDDLIERKIVQKISEGYRRQEVLVSDLMRCKKQLLALDIEDVMRASIGEVIRSLKEAGQHHCLVMDPASHRIRGIFSARDIARKLHIAIDVQDRASFYKVFASVA